MRTFGKRADSLFSPDSKGDHLTIMPVTSNSNVPTHLKPAPDFDPQKLKPTLIDMMFSGKTPNMDLAVAMNKFDHEDRLSIIMTPPQNSNAGEFENPHETYNSSHYHRFKRHSSGY